MEEEGGRHFHCWRRHSRDRAFSFHHCCAFTHTLLRVQETDKATIDVEAQEDGVVAKILVRPHILNSSKVCSFVHVHDRLRTAQKASRSAPRSPLSLNREMTSRELTSSRPKPPPRHQNPLLRSQRLPSPPRLRSRQSLRLHQSRSRQKHPGPSWPKVTASSLHPLQRRLLSSAVSHCPK